jgi:hypothetical protein
MFAVRLSRFVIVLVVLAFSSISAMAQSSVHATVSGRVDDPSGGEVPGASVALINEDTGLVQTVTTGTAGVFQFPRVVPGRYRLEAFLDGFGRARQTMRPSRVAWTGGLDSNVLRCAGDRSCGSWCLSWLLTDHSWDFRAPRSSMPPCAWRTRPKATRSCFRIESAHRTELIAARQSDRAH